MPAAVPSARWVLCDQCGTPLEADPTAAQVVCTCGFEVSLPPRDDAPLGARSDLPEAERLRRLRTQDGRPLLAPPGLERLLLGGELPPHKEREAMELYLADRRALRESTDPAAQERLVFLTMVLANALDDPVRTRALYETTLDAAPLQRHQQTLRGFLARQAARSGNLAQAEAWLAPCDPRSDDLDMDTDWRFSRATLALVRHDWDGVLEVLGRTPDEVPIADANDAVVTVYRAHAHERLGDVETAAQQLADAMAAGDRRAIDAVVAHRPDWMLCAVSIALARERYRATAAASARGMSGGGAGPIMLGVGALTAVMGLGMIIGGVWMLVEGTSEDALGLIIGGVISFVVGGPVVGGIGWRLVRGARRAARIRTDGLPATGTVISAMRTGTEINGVPLMKIALRVEHESREPWVATTKLLVPPQNTSMLQVGNTLYVRFDPQDPSQIVLDTG